LRALRAVLDAGEALRVGEEVVVVDPGDDGQVEDLPAVSRSSHYS
jgi:hypothetical protein